MDRKLYSSQISDQNFGMSLTPEDLILPFPNLSISNYFRPWKWFMENSPQDQGSKIESDSKKFQISLDVQHFKPNEIDVKVVNKEVIIEAKHEERQDEHGFIFRHFVRRYMLPDDCDPDDVTSTLSADGILLVNFNKPFNKVKNDERQVPIKLCSSISKRQPICLQQNIATTTAEKSTQDTAEKICEISNKSEVIKAECDKLSEIINGCAMKTDKLAMNTEAKMGIDIKEMLGTRFSSEIEASMESAENVFGSKSMSEDIKISDAIQETIDKMESSCVATALDESFKMSSEKSEMMSYSSTSSETLKAEESSSFMSSKMASTNEKMSGMLSDTLSAALKEAAENL